MVDSFATPWSVAHQAPLSMGFPRQEYWSGVLFPAPGDLSNPGIQPTSPALQADSLPAELIHLIHLKLMIEIIVSARHRAESIGVVLLQ